MDRDRRTARFVSGAQTVLLINNAGMVQPIGPIEGQNAADIAIAVSLNVATPLMLASALAAASVDATDRRIMHISSGAARNAYPGWSIYCATKAALDHHARAVALDANRALRICSLAPGVIDTNMQAEIRGSGEEQFPMREKFEDLKRNGQLVDTGTMRHPTARLRASAMHSARRRWPTFVRSRSRPEISRASCSRKTSPFG